MPVASDQLVTLDDLNALADLANEAGVVGSPYSFPGPISIFNEFQRLQLNLYTFNFAYFGDGNPASYLPFYPLTRQALVSGPWAVVPITQPFPGIGVIQSATLDGDTSGVYGYPPTYKDQFFAFVGDTGTARVNVTFRLSESSESYYKFFPSNPLYNPSGGVSAKLFRFKGNTGGFAMQLNFLVNLRATVVTTANTLQLFGANASDCTLTSELVSTTAYNATISCTKTVLGEFSFEVGLRDSGSNITLIQYLPAPSRPICTVSCVVTALDDFPILSPSSTGHKITPPDFASLYILWPEQELDTPFEQDGVFYLGNQAPIDMAPASTGKTPPLENRGVWVAKTFPWGKSNSYEGIVNAKAKLPTIAGETFPPISQACQYLRPSYPIGRDTDTNFAINYPDLTGAMIRQVSARRTAVLNADGVGVMPTEKPELTVEFGTMIGQTFNVFQMFTIPEGEDEVRADVFWLANSLFADSLSQVKLVYRCAQKLNVQAAFCTGTSTNKGNNAGSLILDFNGGVGPGLFVESNPIQSFHYNDLEALLLTL